MGWAAAAGPKRPVCQCVSPTLQPCCWSRIFPLYSEKRVPYFCLYKFFYFFSLTLLSLSSSPTASRILRAIYRYTHTHKRTIHVPLLLSWRLLISPIAGDLSNPPPHRYVDSSLCSFHAESGHVPITDHVSPNPSKATLPNSRHFRSAMVVWFLNLIRFLTLVFLF